MSKIKWKSENINEYKDKKWLYLTQTFTEGETTIITIFKNNHDFLIMSNYSNSSVEIPKRCFIMSNKYKNVNLTTWSGPGFSGHDLTWTLYDSYEELVQDHFALLLKGKLY